MPYEEDTGDITIALTGDSLVARRLSPYREPRYLALAQLLRDAAFSVTNAETLFHNYEGSPAWDPGPGGTYVASDPAIIDDLRWFGFDALSCANNHALDYGETGVLRNIENLEARGMPFAGMGRSLAEAEAPRYVDTAAGRVALISVTASLPAAGHRPGNARGPTRARPGVNYLRSEVSHSVPRPEFDALLSMTEGLGLNRRPMSGDQPKLDRSVSEASFLGRRFTAGDRYSTSTTPHAGDLERNLRQVRDARRMADWVVVSLHSHERGRTPDDPADFARTFAHGCIDAGADVVFGHGPHQDRGIELYGGRPIVYALGNFILQNDVVEWQPEELYARYGLGSDATPADLYDHRSGNETRGQVVQPIRWQTAVVLANFESGGLKALRIVPVDLGFETRKRSRRGRPVLAEGAVAAEVLQRFATLSAAYGTKVECRDGVGLINLS